MVTFTGVVSLPLLFKVFDSDPLAPSSPIVTVFVMSVVPAGTGFATVTVNVVELLAPPPASVPTFRVHTLPAGAFGTQLQPVPVYVVFAGTVSVNVTFVAATFPVFVYKIVYPTVLPGVVVMPPSVLLTVRSGLTPSGVVSLPLLFAMVDSGPLAPSSPIVTVFVMSVVPAGTGVATVTVNVVEPLAPPATDPTFCVHVLPVQFHAAPPA
jgi:hypothetical protein